MCTEFQYCLLLTMYVVVLSSYAQVSIKLRNRGQDAYKPKEYGETITVERRISSDGSGSYKLKSHDGR